VAFCCDIYFFVAAVVYNIADNKRLSAKESNTAYFIRQIFWNSFEWRSLTWHLPLEHGDFLNIDISQGSAATWLRRGEIFKYDFIGNLPLSLTVKTFWKSVNIWRSYGHDYNVLFFDSQCILIQLNDLVKLFVSNLVNFCASLHCRGGGSRRLNHVTRQPNGPSHWIVWRYIDIYSTWCVTIRVVHGSISCDPTQPNPIQLTMELSVW